MNRLLLFFVIFLGINITTFATQPPPVEKTFTEMFDSVFSVVSRTQVTTGILYERVFFCVTSKGESESHQNKKKSYICSSAFGMFSKICKKQ